MIANRLLIPLLLLANPILAQQVSDNYEISWDALDGGGGVLISESFVMTDSVGQPVIGASLSANYIMTLGFQTPPDFDADRVKDFLDNCTMDPNTDQYDSNSDGFGSVCDADLNGDLIINFLDLEMMGEAFFTNPTAPGWNADADFNNDGVINFADLFYMEIAFFGAPGPSGIAP